MLELIRNPKIDINPIGNGFYAVINIYDKKNSVHVINKIQKEVLDNIENIIDNPQTKKIIEILTQKNILISQKNTTAKTDNKKELSIWFHTTDNCPLRCTYCHVHKNPKSMTEEVRNLFAQKVIEEAKNSNLKKITLRLAGGEPLLEFDTLKPYLIKLRDDLLKYNCKLEIHFLSGLTVLTDEMINFFKTKQAGIAVSLDGVSSWQDKTRIFANGKGSFSIVEKNIKKLIDNDIKPYIMIVISDQNIDGLIELTQYLIKNQLGFRHAFVKGQELNRKKVIDTLHKCYDLLEKEIANNYNSFHLHQLSDIRFLQSSQNACGAGKSSFSLYTDGGMYLCQILHQEAPFGSIYANENLIATLEKSGHQDFHTKTKKCQECKYYKICSGGCPLDKQENCEIFTEIIPRVYDLLGKNELIKILGKEKYKKIFKI